MIDITKKYKTRDDREVRIYATDGGGDRPVHGAVINHGEWFLRHWSAKGTAFPDHGHCSDDLIEVKQRIQLEVWVNVDEDIERLRGQAEFEKKCRNDAFDELKKQDAEIERLRAALLPFASIKADHGEGFSGLPDMVIVRCEASVREIKAARAALGEK